MHKKSLTKIVTRNNNIINLTRVEQIEIFYAKFTNFISLQKNKKKEEKLNSHM